MKPDQPFVEQSQAALPNSKLEASKAHSPETDRLFGLDILRFAAVALVIHIHAASGFRPFAISDLPSYSLIFPPGSNGVDLFFVLSGFLVSGLLFNEFKQYGTISLGRFFVRRAFKIYPCFWVLILFTLFWGRHQTGSFDWTGLWPELFFFQNYVPGLWEHTWSLAVEEHFYLLLIVAFLMIKVLSRTSEGLKIHLAPRAFEVAFVVCMIGRVLTWTYIAHTLHRDRWSQWTTHVRVDALFFGMLLAYYWHLRWSAAMKARLLAFKWIFLGAGMVLISALMPHVINETVWELSRFVFVYVGAGCLLLASLSLKPFSAFGSLRWMAWIGRHSYSIYLWHFLVLVLLKPWAASLSPSLANSLIIELTYYLASWVFGIVTAQLIEFPMLRLRDKWFPSRPRTAGKS